MPLWDGGPVCSSLHPVVSFWYMAWIKDTSNLNRKPGGGLAGTVTFKDGQHGQLLLIQLPSGRDTSFDVGLYSSASHQFPAEHVRIPVDGWSRAWKTTDPTSEDVRFVHNRAEHLSRVTDIGKGLRIIDFTPSGEPDEQLIIPYALVSDFITTMIECGIKFPCPDDSPVPAPVPAPRHVSPLGSTLFAPRR